MSFADRRSKWEQARYNRRTYERLIRLMKLLKCEATNTNIRDSRYCRDFIGDFKEAVLNGYPPDFTPSPGRSTLLSYATNCRYCRRSAIIHALIQAGADVNRPDRYGESMLQRYIRGYIIVFSYYGRQYYSGIDEHEAGAVFSEILEKTADVNYISPSGETALSQLCKRFLWLKARPAIPDLHSRELLAARIYELLDAGADFESFREGQDSRSEGMQDLTRMVYEYRAYKDMAEDVTEQDLAAFAR